MPSFNDPSGRGPSGPTLAVRGLCYLLAVAGAITALILQSQGAFRDDLHATAVVGDVGDGLPSGSDLKVRGVLVGKVGKVESKADGGKHLIHLEFKREYAQAIPASVKARILPTNLFGAPFVDLIPGDEDTTPLAENAVVPGDDSAEALQVQTAITKAREILTAVEPAKLETALTGLSQALRGRGGQFNSLLGRLDAYLSALTPHTATFSHDLSTLATALEGLQVTAPALLDTVDAALITSRTIVEKQQQFARTLAGGAATVDTVRGLLDDNADRTIKIVHNTTPVVKTLAQHATDIPLSFQALGNGVRTLNGAFAGPYHWLDIDLVISLTPFTPYNSADCPRYRGLDGPNCGDPIPRQPVPAEKPPSTPTPAVAPQLAPAPAGVQPPPRPSVAVPGGLVGPVGSQQEKDTIGTLLGDPIGSLASLLLGPLLRGTTVGPR